MPTEIFTEYNGREIAVTVSCRPPRAIQRNHRRRQDQLRRTPPPDGESRSPRSIRHADQKTAFISLGILNVSQHFTPISRQTLGFSPESTPFGVRNGVTP